MLFSFIFWPCTRSGASQDSRTSLTAKLVAVSLNWNRTTCVVYGTSGAWLPNRYTDHCTMESKKMNSPAMHSASASAPNAFLGISIELDRGSLLLAQTTKWVARFCGGIAVNWGVRPCVEPESAIDGRPRTRQ